MEQRWSLNELYRSFDSNEFNNDLEEFDNKIEEILNWTNANLDSQKDSSKKLEDFIILSKDFYAVFAKLMAFTNLSISVDTTNEEALRTLDILQEKSTNLTEPFVRFQNWLGSLKDLDSDISKSQLIKDHEFYLKELASQTKYLLSEKEEVLISKMSNTGSKAWSKLQNLLTSTLMVDIEIEGKQKELPLPIVRNLAYDKDGKTRRSAYDAELKSYEKIEDSSAACLNGIKGEVITTTNLRGYESPLEETLINSRMDKASLDAMLLAMKESLPSFHKYLKTKANMLDYKKGLPFYDLFAPMGNLHKKFTYDEARDYIVNNFGSFSEELAEFAENAFNNNWIDSEPRQGKKGGAFCYNIHPIGESRILSNFTGNFKDVITLAHELGHGYHGHTLKEKSILNSSYPMPLAETASIFCETIVMNAAIKEADKDEAFTLLEDALQSATQVIVDIYSRFLFESKLFDLRGEYSISSNQLQEIMLEAQIEAYGDGLDHENLHPYMWINKPHYYSADNNFYNFPYAFGLLFAKGIYAKYLESGDDFIKKYDELLAATGKNNIADVAKMMDIDIHKIDFWKSSLRIIEQDIERFIELSKSL